jgi:Uma2 family endonuclease
MQNTKSPPSPRPLTREVAELFPVQGEWTEEEYLRLPDTNRLIELSNAKLEMLAMPTDAHQRVVGQLFFLLTVFLRQSALGVLRIAPLRVRLGPGRFREPDLIYMANEHADRITNDYWGVPDLAVEVHSPDSRVRDRQTKRGEYARAGIAEYWMVDLDAATIEVYVLQAGDYVLHGSFVPGAVLSSTLLPDLRLNVVDVFAE